MWRMPYSIARNLHNLPRVVGTTHRMTDRPDLYTQQERYDYVRYAVGLMKRSGHMKTRAYGEENLPPEGGYDNKKRNSLWDFKPGCFKAAVKAKAPIVPVALVDSYKVYNSWSVLPVKTQVHYLKPLYYDEYKDMNTHQISAVVKARIQAKLSELGKL